MSLGLVAAALHFVSHGVSVPFFRTTTAPNFSARVQNGPQIILMFARSYPLIFSDLRCPTSARTRAPDASTRGAGFVYTDSGSTRSSQFSDLFARLLRPHPQQESKRGAVPELYHFISSHPFKLPFNSVGLSLLTSTFLRPRWSSFHYEIWASLQLHVTVGSEFWFIARLRREIFLKVVQGHPRWTELAEKLHFNAWLLYPPRATLGAERIHPCESSFTRLTSTSNPSCPCMIIKSLSFPLILPHSCIFRWTLFLYCTHTPWRQPHSNHMALIPLAFQVGSRNKRIISIHSQISMKSFPSISPFASTTTLDRENTSKSSTFLPALISLSLP